MIQKIAIIGVGLIGGSLSMALKKHRKDLEIIGFDQTEVMDEALKRQAIDYPAASLKDAVQQADLVILAVPIAKILHLTTEMAPFLRPGTIVTDVGSVKRPVMDHARNVLPASVTFIGGHPMAGSEKSGVHHADPFLFENVTYVLCPPNEISHDAFIEKYQSLIDIIKAIGARIFILPAERHDRIAAAVSHLPQLLSVTLMNYVSDYHEEDDAYLQLAAGGFRDMTRIASSSFEMWRDILVANEGPILDMLAGFATSLQKMRNRVFGNDLQQLNRDFQQARIGRDLIPKHSKGFLHPLADVYVYAEDKPGFLYKLIGVLHEAEIDIKDLELLKIREGIEGVFRIGFTDKKIAKLAIEVLEKSSYTAFIM
ncbi:MAG: prephenate dehydrogenase/arogenate dehydrogenase family protein [Rhodothermales bacterium]